MQKTSPAFPALFMIAVIVAFPVSSTAQTNAPPPEAELSEIKAPDGWKRVTIRVSWRGGGVSLDELGKVRTAEVIYSGTADTSGNVSFSCYNGRPSVSFAIRPTNMREMLTNPPDSSRMKLQRPKISINGERIKSEDWIYMPAMKVYRARRIAPLKSLYNATVRGADVRVKTRGDDIRLNIPKADTVFKNFGAECGLGLRAER